MALQRSTIAGTTNASFNSLVPTSTTAGAIALASAVTVGVSANVVDHLVTVTALLGAITPSSSTLLNVFVYGSADGTKWPGGSATTEVIDGTDKTLTLSTNGNNMRFLGSILCHTASITMVSEPLSIAAAFNGAMPAKYQIVLQNATGVALASSGHSVNVQEIYYS